MSLVSQPLLGLEDIQRAAWRILFENLNDVIDMVAAWKASGDQEVAMLRGVAYEPTTLEHIAPDNFYEGHRPSLISSPVDHYPNVAAMATRAAPATGSDQLDQMTVYRDTLIIDVMVKSIDSEEEVNRRVQRTAEATNICIMQNQTLGGILHGLDTAPTVDVSDVFTRKERTAYGPHWYWQGARLTYAVRKEAADPPPTSSGSIFRAGMPPGFDIDQA